MTLYNHFSLFFEGFTLDKLREKLRGCGDCEPYDYIDDVEGDFPIIAFFGTPKSVDEVQQYLKDSLGFRAPTGDQIEQLGFDGAREFARS